MDIDIDISIDNRLSLYYGDAKLSVIKAQLIYSFIHLCYTTIT
jgi:hypothetical protein